MKTENKTITASVRSGKITVDVRPSETIEDVIKKVLKDISKNPTEFLTVHVDYTNARMLNDLRKCHARAIGCPEQSDIQKESIKALKSAGVKSFNVEYPVFKVASSSRVIDVKSKNPPKEHHRSHKDEFAPPDVEKALEDADRDAEICRQSGLDEHDIIDPSTLIPDDAESEAVIDQILDNVLKGLQK